MAGFMRKSKNGESWTYESSDRYSLRFERNCAVDGWTAVTLDGFTIALFMDAAMATAFKDTLNRASQLAAKDHPSNASGGHDEGRPARGEAPRG